MTYSAHLITKIEWKKDHTFSIFNNRLLIDLLEDYCAVIATNVGDTSYFMIEISKEEFANIKSDFMENKIKYKKKYGNNEIIYILEAINKIEKELHSSKTKRLQYFCI